MAESDQRLLNLRRIAERIEDADELTCPEKEAPIPAEKLKLHYNIADNCITHHLGDFVSELAEDPAMKVRLYLT